MRHLPVILGGIGGALAGFIAVSPSSSCSPGPGGSGDAAAGRMMVAFFLIAPFGALSPD